MTLCNGAVSRLKVPEAGNAGDMSTILVSLAGLRSQASDDQCPETVKVFQMMIVMIMVTMIMVMMVITTLGEGCWDDDAGVGREGKWKKEVRILRSRR